MREFHIAANWSFWLLIILLNISLHVDRCSGQFGVSWNRLRFSFKKICHSRRALCCHKGSVIKESLDSSPFKSYTQQQSSTHFDEMIKLTTQIRRWTNSLNEHTKNMTKTEHLKCWALSHIYRDARYIMCVAACTRDDDSHSSEIFTSWITNSLDETFMTTSLWAEEKTMDDDDIIVTFYILRALREFCFFFSFFGNFQFLFIFFASISRLELHSPRRSRDVRAQRIQNQRKWLADNLLICENFSIIHRLCLFFLHCPFTAERKFKYFIGTNSPCIERSHEDKRPIDWNTCRNYLNEFD